jgi:hypothetical protein
MNMENFITGFPGHEHEHRAAMLEVLGQEKYDFFFDKVCRQPTRHAMLSPSHLKVPRLFLYQFRCQVLCRPRHELHPHSVQLSPL